MSDAPRYFFGIGAQKAGTTWLHDVLNTYPDCALPPLKELHFFDVRHLPDELNTVRIYKERLRMMLQLSEGFGRDVEAYYSRFGASVLQNFKTAAEGAGKGKQGQGPARTFQDGYLANVNVEQRLLNIERIARYLRIRDVPGYVAYLDELRLQKQARVVGEFTPSYSMLPPAAFAEMDRMLPGCRFIFLMRDPLDRFFSQLRFRKKVLARQGINDFDPVKHFDEAMGDVHFLQRSDYRQTLETLESVIPRDRILYLFFEEMVAPATVVDSLRQVEGFLGLGERSGDELTAFCERKSNPSEDATFSPAQRARARRALEPVYAFVEARFGRLPAAWTRAEAR